MKRQNITAIVIVAISLVFVNLTFAAPPRYEIIDLGTLGGDDSSADCISNNGGIVGYSENSLFHERAVSFDPTVKSNITNLGTLGVRYSDARTINNVGQVAGWSDTADGLSSHAYLWDPINGMVDLGALPGMECSCASALNDFGVVVGSSGHCDDDNAFIWDCINGMHYLEKGPSGDSVAGGINNAGQVIGYVWRSDLHDVSAFLWNSDSGVVELGTLGGRASCAIAINNAGQVVGWADTPSMAEHAFIWDSINGMRDLGTLGGTDNSWALDISDNGHVVGCSEPRSDDAHAFIWDSGTGMIDLGPGYACAINDGGQIVGYGSRSAPGFYSPAFYWDIVNGRISLIDLLPSGSGWQELIRALDINNRGQIVGSGITSGGQYHAFVMTPVPPKTIYVDDDSAGANDGSSWADAYNYLQDALSAAWPGDEIRVAEGIYTPDSNSADPNGSGDRTATFQLINGVTLKGGYAGAGEPDPDTRDFELFKTVFSGDLHANDALIHNASEMFSEPTREDNSYHVITAIGVDRTPILDGFTITAGHSFGWPDNKNGAAMLIEDCSPTITNCIFQLNCANRDGGGVYVDHGNPRFISCEFRSNAAYRYGGGVGLDDNSTPVLKNCKFSENAATDGGGLNSDDSTPSLTGCTFLDNYVDFFGPDSADGAGIYLYYSSARLENCLLARNLSNQVGGGICTGHKSYATLVNCTLAGNFGYGVYSYGTTWLINSIVWDNKPDGSHGNAYGEYNCIQGTWEGDGVGNIHDDPCFADPNDDYHLLPNSPCIDAGDPDYIVKPNETDLDGKPRIIDGRIDMGAYEAPILAEAKILPRTINLASRGKSITCYIWLPDEYDVADIDPNSVLLEDSVPTASFSVDEQKQVATAAFDREKVQSILNVGDIELTITCQLADGTVFEGTDTIKVTDKAGK